MSLIVSRRDFGPDGFRWITLTEIEWRDPTGKLRRWESAERTTRRGDVDGVAIIARVTGGGQPPRIILEKQFRPPQGNYVVELPAGLVDEGETAAAAALRELKEETGYSGAVGRTSSVCYSDPGMTNANMQFCDIHVDADAPENADVRPELEEGEFIEVFMLPLEGLYARLLELQRESGIDVDARLLMYAAGLDDGGELLTSSSGVAAAGGNGGGRHSQGFRESVMRGLVHVGSRTGLSLSRAGSAAVLPPAVEVTIARPGSFASLRGLDSNGDGDGNGGNGDAAPPEAASDFGQPGSLHPQDSAKGPPAILMSTQELAAAGIESVRIVPRGTLRWHRLDRALLWVGGLGLVTGLALSQVVAGLALVVGLNYHPSHRLHL